MVLQVRLDVLDRPTKQTHRQQTWREYWQEFAKLPRWPKPEFQAWPTDLFHQLEFIGQHTIG